MELTLIQTLNPLTLTLNTNQYFKKNVSYGKPFVQYFWTVVW